VFRVIPKSLPVSPLHAARTSSTTAPPGSSLDAFREFFHSDAYLSVSGQLEAEMMASALSRVYSFGPTFRAESHSHTVRHLAEFWMLEPEMAFCDLEKNMDFTEYLLKQTITQLLEKCKDDLAFLNKWVDNQLLEKLRKTAQTKFHRLNYTDAIHILQKQYVRQQQQQQSTDSTAKPSKITSSNEQNEIPTFAFAPEYGKDLQREHEQYLCEHYFGGEPVFVINWPAEIKPFYMRLNEDGKTVAAMDLLLPGVGEVVGGSQREDRYEILQTNLAKHNLNKNGEYNWYLDLRKYGSVPHSGFGLGFERFVRYVTAMKNIRDVIPVPRYKGYCKF
jgi:asparaginyl-tRNA synthetase